MIDLVHKLPELDSKLITLLQSLSEDEWQAQTVAKLWKVKDVAAHLLDGNLRILSGLRDGHQGHNPTINSYQDLLDYLNQLNADWVQAMKRVSPAMLIDLLKHTGPPYYEYYASLDPQGKAVYSVAWAGEEESKNWMHIAREYTEKFLHQQQIRDAVNKPGIMTAEFFQPFLDVCMYALPHTLRETSADNGNTILMHIEGEAGGQWLVAFNGEQWQRQSIANDLEATSTVTIQQDASWKLFSKSLRAADLEDQIRIAGDQELGRAALEMVSFMA